MARRSARIASSQGSQVSSSPPAPAHSSPPATGKKRKAEPGDSPSAKRGKKGQKDQMTIEESMDVDVEEKQAPESQEVKPSEPEPPKDTEQGPESAQKIEPEQSNGQANGSSHPEKELSQEAGAKSTAPDEAQDKADSAPGKDSEDKADKAESKEEPEAKEKPEAKEEPEAKSEEPKPTATNGDNAVVDGARDDKVPSSILEKGIIYFFFRGRVNVDDPKNVQDLQRSFFVLRPLPHGAKIGDGSIGDEKNCKLIAIPKKMLPVSGNDRWTAFVETANVSFKELKESFLKSDQYDTQTGPRTTPAATPVAEGVYAITSTGRETHLAYILTLPEKLGDIQSDLGLRQQGSFVVSVKNPKAPGPANADLGKDPGYSEEILNTFRGLRWSPLQPKMLDYEACQFLLIGEGEKGLEKATEAQPGDEKKDETPKEEIEKLEEEDEMRVEHLNGEDAVFADLGTNAKDYPALQTTW